MKRNFIRLGILTTFVIVTVGPASGNETATYSYDALGRLVSTSTSGTVNNGLSVAATFDAAGNRSNYTVTGPVVIIPSSYSASSNSISSTGLSGTGAGMRDAVYNSISSVHGTNGGTDEWVMMDLGSAKAVGKVVLVPINASFTGGWGPTYLNTAALERSNDGSSWTSVTTVSGTADGVKTEFAIGATTRYLRIRKNSWLGVGDFYALTP